MEKERAIIKYNGGNLAILCSNCSVLIKVGYQMTPDEISAMRGEKHLDPQYCTDCKSGKKTE